MSNLLTIVFGYIFFLLVGIKIGIKSERERQK